MADSTKLRVTELDFDTIKSNLKDYLQSQTEFTDYDFEGSALSNLLDLLAYNTHYNAIYANFVANEVFLDTAVKRSSVVSLAKHFGYTPRSIRSPKAKINLSVVTSGAPQSLLLPINTPFVTTIDGFDYTFYNRSNIIVSPTSTNNFTFSNVEIVEGTPLSYRYTVANNQKTFILPNSNIDTSTLTVEIQNSVSDATRTTYTLAEDIVAVSSTDTVYFLEETRDGVYQIVFGDDTIGKALANGNIVNVTYLISNGIKSNGATSFTLGSSAGFTISSATITLAQKAAGGKESESVESIRYNASRFFTTQNRAVTAEDYKNIILAEYSDIDAISAWGGDENEPPIYGKVFISAKPTNGTTLSNELKTELGRVLQKKNVVGITPEFVDPEILYLTINTKFYFDPSKTTQQPSTIQANVISAIKQFRDAYLDNFDTIFRKSKFSRSVDYTNKAILNSNTDVEIYKILKINTENPVNYTVSFVNPVNSISSTAFRLYNDSELYYMEDDGVGNIRRFHYNNNQKIFDSLTFGTIDYEKGIIRIPTVAISLLTDNCKIFAKPKLQDINALRNQILTILDSDITVEGNADTRKPLVR
jgi:hypothetical protein